MNGGPLLTLAGVRSSYGHVEALKGVELTVGEGEIVTLIGANGAGKSTLLMTICGRPTAHAGQITFAGRDITDLPTFEIVRLGIAQCPEGRRIFPRMTVMENLLMGTTVTRGIGSDADFSRVFDLFPKLAGRRDQRAGTMSGGEQQMLAIARALMSRPRLLLLDEPSLGLAPLIVKQIFEVIQEVNRLSGMTVLLVEQNAYQALRVAHRGYVLQTGQVVLSGPASELLANKDIQAAYLEGGS